MRKGWLKVKKASQHAGVSERTLWSWANQGLPYAKVNGTALFNLDDLDAFIRKHMVNRNEVQDLVKDVLKTLSEGKRS